MFSNLQLSFSVCLITVHCFWSSFVCRWKSRTDNFQINGKAFFFCFYNKSVCVYPTYSVRDGIWIGCVISSRKMSILIEIDSTSMPLEALQLMTYMIVWSSTRLIWIVDPAWNSIGIIDKGSLNLVTQFLDPREGVSLKKRICFSG